MRNMLGGNMSPEEEKKIIEIVKTSAKPEVFAHRMSEVATKVMGMITKDTEVHKKIRLAIIEHGVSAVSPILIIDYINGAELKTEVVDIYDIMKRGENNDIISGIEDLARQWFTSRCLPVSSVFIVTGITMEKVSKIPEAKGDTLQAILLEGLTFTGISHSIIFKVKTVKDKLKLEQEDFGSNQDETWLGKSFLKSFFTGYMQMVKTMKNGKIEEENNTTH